MPEIALAKVDPAAPLDVVCTLACGATTGIGAALYTAKVRVAARRASSSAPGSSASGWWPAAGSPGPSGSSASTGRRDRLEMAQRTRRDGRHRRPATDTVEQIVEMTDGFGADYTFEATGLVSVMRQAVESARMGWGLCTVAGVAGKGETLDVVPRFLITGRRVAGSSFGGAKGRDRVPELVRLYLDGQARPRELHLPPVPLDDVNHGFELMEQQDGIRSVLTFA